MSCETLDWKAYALGEVGRGEQAKYDQHAAACAECRDELERLRVTQSALLSVAEEEIPRKIAFVSDRVFEPRWYQTIWRSGPAMGFASAVLVAGAILAHGFARPVVLTAPVAAVDTAQIERRVQNQLDQRVEAAVAKAVAEVERRSEERDAKMLAAAEHKFSEQRKTDLLAAQQTIGLMQNQLGRFLFASNYTSPK